MNEKQTHTYEFMSQDEVLWNSCADLLFLIRGTSFLTEQQPSTMELRSRLRSNFYVIISSSNFAISLHIEEPHFNYENNLKRILPDLSRLQIFVAYGVELTAGIHEIRAYLLPISSVFITSFLPEINEHYPPI
jgi:hypothetical protein